MNEQPNAISFVVADDHKMMRNGILSTLTLTYPNKYSLLFDAVNGEDLIEKLHAAPALPDIVFLDVSMPIMNGYEAMSIIRKEWPELKVLGLSMYIEDEVVTKMLFSGARGFVAKDSGAAEIDAAVSALMGGGAYFHGVSSIFTSQTVEQLKTYLPNLTDKEMKFLKLCATEMKYEDMAQELNLSVRSIHSYRDILFKKFSISSRVGLAFFAIRIGLVPNVDFCQGGATENNSTWK